MLIRAVKSWIAFERCRNRFRKVFGSTVARCQRERVESLAIRLLVWHMERGETLETIEGMIDAPNAGIETLARKEQNNG